MRFMHSDYTVAWICALPLERAAAEVMLDEIHEPLPQPHTDPNAYVLGILNGHHVVVACLPTGVYGAVSAATVVSHLISTFRHIQYGLMVGIGGGVPNNVNSIYLGDVVVSKPTGPNSGIVQYDYGKAIRGGRFEQTGMLNYPPQVLLTHMGDLQAREMTQENNSLADIVQDVLERNPGMKEKFAAPNQDTDYLFQSSYHHIEHESDCEKCDKSQLVDRQRRNCRAPQIHHGLIASGNQVMKDPEVRDRLAKELGIICFEMEAAGIANQLQTLVIRGICDYCDSHKLKGWQGYAALTAAAYTKMLLSAVPVRPNVNFADDFANPPCLQALQCPDPFVVKNRLKETKDKLVFKAIEWVLRNPQYCRWQNGDDVRLLWIRGGAGKGKTMMSIGLVEQFSEDDSSIVTYFFCQDTDYQLNTMEGIIKGLIQQLIRQRKELIEFLQCHWDPAEASFTENMSSWRRLWDVLLEMINHCRRQRVYVVVDALDECQNGEIGEFLKLIVRTGLDNANVRWLLTSRPLDDADRELLNTTQEIGIGLELHFDYLEAAIKTYVSHKVRELYPVHRYGQNIPQSLETQLLEKAEGTFLWVSLVCKRLENDGSGARVPPDEALSAIQEFPPGLHSLYERMFEQLLQGKPTITKSCLRLLKVMTMVYRPLNRAEVFTVTGLSEREILAGENIVARCASFIKIRGVTVEFVHQSSREFLVGTSLLSSRDQYGHADIALSSLRYMSTVLKPNLIDLPWPNSGRHPACPGERISSGKSAILDTLDYAVTLWAEHLQAASPSDLVQEALSEHGLVSTFINEKLLEWLECISLLGRLSRAMGVLKTLEALAEVCLTYCAQTRIEG